MSQSHQLKNRIGIPFPSIVHPLQRTCVMLAVLCVSHFFLGAVASAAPGTDWKQTTWNGEKAWVSASAGWTAIISEERSRLVSIAATDRGENILYALTKNAVSRGGHVCWLGPQPEWITGWPPTPDWEGNAPLSVTAAGPKLTLVQSHAEPHYPQLTRTYEWRDGVLHCGLGWQGDRFHAVQIIQVPRYSIVHIKRAVKEDFPTGYVLLLNAKEPSTTKPVAAGDSRVEGDDITLWHANIAEKLGVYPQEITAEIGQYQLKVRRGAQTGVSESTPNLGLITQIYLGGWECPFVELEQLSAFGSDKPSVAEILLEPGIK